MNSTFLTLIPAFIALCAWAGMFYISRSRNEKRQKTQEVQQPKKVTLPTKGSLGLSDLKGWDVVSRIHYDSKEDRYCFVQNKFDDNILVTSLKHMNKSDLDRLYTVLKEFLREAHGVGEWLNDGDRDVLNNSLQSINGAIKVIEELIYLKLIEQCDSKPHELMSEENFPDLLAACRWYCDNYEVMSKKYLFTVDRRLVEGWATKIEVKMGLRPKPVFNSMYPNLKCIVELNERKP